ncbi:iron ABC transporter permease [Poseidonocella sp. HB161398]|uniref:FecCD family ABC transporter permease n=1 Tax=Poseidonocella sp. HB161398 TaxID=2320855 RepID=UPI001109587F|nr:iron ABC transporter permease [Poseidonocella sp. HB161398]
MTPGTTVLRLGRVLSLPVGRRFLIVAPLLLLALLASCWLALAAGYSGTRAADIWQAVTLPREAMEDPARMIAGFRMPRIVAAVLAGSMMAASGYLLQVVSRNGLADPGLLGLSDGASVAVLLGGALAGSAVIAPPVLAALALAGSLGAALLVVGLGRRMLTGGGIILVGLATSIFLGSIVEIILVTGSAMNFSALMQWSRGTLAAVDAADARLLGLWWLLLVPLALGLGRSMSPLLLGDAEARALGVPTRASVAAYIILAAAFAAPVVATCGPVAFIGLMASYVARSLVGDRPTEVLLAAMLSGGLILLWADTAGRTLFGPVQVSAGIMISVVGVLVFVLAARAGRLAR